MKLNALPRTNVKVALDKIRAYELTANEQETALKTLYDSFDLFQMIDFVSI